MEHHCPALLSDGLGQKVDKAKCLGTPPPALLTAMRIFPFGSMSMIDLSKLSGLRRVGKQGAFTLNKENINEKQLPNLFM